MTVLSLGVVDVAYKDEKASTTGEVAEILEEKYHIMRTFLELNENLIGDALAEKMVSRMDSPVLGKKDMPIDPVDEKFRDFLDSNTMSRILPLSQQSAASEAGVNHRKKHAYSKSNSARPAFIDTGLYQASFRTILKF